MYNREPTVQVAAALFQELCYSNKDRLSAGLIIAGYDPQNGAEVYHIPAGGSLHKQDFSIGGSGSTYIYGFCDANFKENMTREEAINFVKNGIPRPRFWVLTCSVGLGDESRWKQWWCH